MKNVCLVSAALFFAACTAGTFEPLDPGATPNPDPGSSPDAALVIDPGSFTLVVATPDVDSQLDKRLSYQATISSVDGFAGDVVLDLADVPEDWVVSYDPSPTVSVADGASVDVSIHFDVPSIADPGLHDFSVKASNDAVPSQESLLSAELLNVVDLPIANLTGNLVHDYPPKTVRLGTEIRFVNMDTTQRHRIHSNLGAIGFPHQENEMDSPLLVGEEGGDYPITITEVGTYNNWYCHIHGDAYKGMIEIVE